MIFAQVLSPDGPRRLRFIISKIDKIKTKRDIAISFAALDRSEVFAQDYVYFITIILLNGAVGCKRMAYIYDYDIIDIIFLMCFILQTSQPDKVEFYCVCIRV